LTIGGVSLLTLLSLALRPLFPVDETRYIAVAWEMWEQREFLVPHLNGEPYSHKPPGLFWLIHAGWAIFGVNQWWPRLIAPLSLLLSLWSLARLGGTLWPATVGIGRLGSLMFLATWFVTPYQTMLMFDMPLLACISLSWLALTHAVRSGQAWLWLGFGLALGCGILLKGPVALVYALPPLFACKWWAPAGAPACRVRWTALALVLAVMVPMAWLAAASLHGSREYISTLLIDQTMDRISGEMGHPRPWYWYLPIMLLLPMPWVLWWPAVRATAREMLNSEDRGNRFVLSILIPGLLVLSAAGGKQVHYLIPLLAVLMLLVSRGLHDPGVSTRRRHSLVPALLMSPLVLPGLVVLIGIAEPQLKPWLPVFPIWSLLALGLVAIVVLRSGRRKATNAAKHLAVASIAFCAIVAAVALPTIRPRYDLEAAGRYIGTQQSAGRPTAYIGNYQGEFTFFGRLRAPVTELKPAQATDWAAQNPNGLIVSRTKRLLLLGSPTPEYRQVYKGDELLMFRALDLSSTGSQFRNPRDPE
jgi:4-amino-4-deoxy-L-arabinose transferase-like glycosyltransferase